MARERKHTDEGITCWCRPRVIHAMDLVIVKHREIEHGHVEPQLWWGDMDFIEDWLPIVHT